MLFILNYILLDLLLVPASRFDMPVSETPVYTTGEGPARLLMCDEDGPAGLLSADPLSLMERGRLKKLTVRYSHKRYLKPLVKHQLGKKGSFLRKFLGKVGQDPSNEIGELSTGTLNFYKTVPVDFVKALNNVAGETSTVLGYLWAFGYIPNVMNKKEKSTRYKRSSKHSDSVISPCIISEAVEAFQKFNGISETGILDQATMKMFKKKRCGMPDVGCKSCESSVKGTRSKRYALRKRKWKNFDNLRYFVQNCTSTLPYTICKQEIKKGLEGWTKVAPIVFRETATIDEADVILYFVRGEHKKDSPFDGPGGVLGHAYFPRGGHLHYDLDENFTANSKHGINLQFLTMHEMGHVLGLMHSRVTSAVMYPLYDQAMSVSSMLTLSSDDKEAIVKNYGSGIGRVISLDD